ncbi:SIS domain-containing protein [Agathobaculum sp. NTUH-O15-33]|uniref:D-sedoheptulose-7-phosphate isomerase n=1 Tax=Agathobaculum sp. NTUH-O15-33 TaxID=3079302 RepID=UPI0029588AC1|nr:SIS domain-containing protein [Agathobaculum sp. NTUH-O15-33]WNX84093.1 SIS domain-containing protein [Agathobaculum sp. NTUH-O15-33]
MRNTTRIIYCNLLERYPVLCACKAEIEAAIESLLACFSSGGKLLVCGNGGSASDSEHIVGELMKTFMLDRPLDADMQKKLRSAYPEHAEAMIAHLQRAVPAISLVSETALMTAYTNDNSAEMAFAQQVLSYGREGDILLGISTSGNSANILNAARIARIQGVTTIALTGQSGGKVKSLSDICICAPSDITYQIQEYHLPIYHCLCACVENELFGVDT